MGVIAVTNASAPLRIMLVNGKGGCGKTTIATNLAGHYAARGLSTALFDHDPQGGAMRWLSLRDPARAAVHGASARRMPAAVTRTWQLRSPPGTDRVIIDTPAGIHGNELADLVRRADVLLIPVLPSDADIHAASHFIAELLVSGRLRANPVRVAVVANRVRRNTRIFQSLERFLRSLSFPFVTTLRDTQNYVHAAEQGLGVHEMRPPSRVRRDLEQWAPLLGWIERGTASPASLGKPTGHSLHFAHPLT